MNCAVCHRANLPGGVRCSYCGAPFAAAPEFDLGIGAAQSGGSPAPGSAKSAGTPAGESSKPGKGPNSGKGKGALGGVAGVIAYAAVKGKALLSLPKLGAALVTLSTMFVAIWAYQLYFGWPFSIGLVFCILIHELGHVAVNRRWGLKATAPMFIPFLGAVILINRFPSNPRAESESGAGGPIGGLLASLVCAILWRVTGAPLWLGLAYVSFAINLFNLMPVWQLDGAHIAAVFSPANWYFVMLVLLLWTIKIPSPLLWIILVIALFVGVDAARKGRSQMVSPGVRARMVAVYLGLCLSLGLGTNLLNTTAGPYIDHLQSAERTPASAATLRTGAPGTPAAGSSKAGAAPAGATSNGHAVRKQMSEQQFRRSARGLWMAAALIAYHFWWVIGIICAVGWLLVTLLLSMSAGVPYGWKSAAGAIGMSALYGLIYALSRLWSIHFSPGSPVMTVVTVRYEALAHAGMIGLFTAYLAAEAAALVFAVITVARRRTAPKLSSSRLTWRCLVWMAGGALLVAYWNNNLWALAITLLGAAIFFASRRWLVFSLGGQLKERLGDLQGSLALWRRALLERPDAEGTADLWNGIARVSSVLGHSEETLEAIDAASASDVAADATGLKLFLNQVIRAEALIHLDRFDDALRLCETLLQAPEGDRVGLWRPAVVHGVLAKMALYRGWYDEAAAQANCVLRSRVPKNQPWMLRTLVAATYISRARSQAAMGEYEAALADCDKASQLLRSPLMDSQVAMTRAQIALFKGDAAGAEHQSAEAMRLLPGNLQVRYWRGRALIAAGRRDEGEPILRALIQEFPRHHWATLAQSYFTQENVSVG